MFCEKINRVRIVLCALGMGVVVGLVVARLVKIQICEADGYRVRASKQYTGIVERQAPRGRIYGRNGVLLAGNCDAPTVIAIPKAVENPLDTAEVLSPILDVPVSRLVRAMTMDKVEVYLKRKVDPETRRKIEELKIQGIGFRNEPGRSYPNNELAAHTLGYCMIDNEGAAGIEGKLDNMLQGDKYRYKVTLDGHGRILETWDLESANPNRGIDVLLTIDSTIQHFAEEALSAQCAESQAVGGSAVVLDVKSGEILACANYPGFDPNSYRESTPEDQANRAVAHLYEPGSVQKVATILAAISEKTVNPQTVIHVGNSTYTVAGHTYKDDHPWKPNLTVAEVMTISSNVGAIKISEMLGEGAFVTYMEKFGFLDTPCSDLPGTARMSFSRPGSSGWSKLSMPSMAFGGAEIMVSAMGMAAFFNAVANDGVYVKPHVMKALRSSLDGQERPYDEVESRRIAPDWAAEQVREMMLLVTEAQKGTGTRARIDGVPVFGKTGTVRKWDPEIRMYSGSKIIASFGGSFPFEDPKITIFVVIDEPKGDTYGGLVAAPVFQKIGDFCVSYLGIPRDKSEPSKEGEPWCFPVNPVFAEDPALDGKMPLLLGMTLGQACSILIKNNIVPDISGSGIVVWQDPPNGAPMDLRPVKIKLAPEVKEPAEPGAGRST